MSSRARCARVNGFNRRINPNVCRGRACGAALPDRRTCDKRRAVCRPRRGGRREAAEVTRAPWADENLDGLIHQKPGRARCPRIHAEFSLRAPRFSEGCMTYMRRRISPRLAGSVRGGAAGAHRDAGRRPEGPPRLQRRAGRCRRHQVAAACLKAPQALGSSPDLIVTHLRQLVQPSTFLDQRATRRGEGDGACPAVTGSR
jgi:hypothetical protein